MTLKYLNERYCARCHRDKATPYLRDNIKILKEPTGRGQHGNTLAYHTKMVLDLGCGNMRNTNFMRKQGFDYVMPMDMAPGEDGLDVILGKDAIPCVPGSADIILANYIFMFLNQNERKQLCREINLVAAPGCTLVMELYASKHSFAKTVEETEKMKKQLMRKFKGWELLRSPKERFIMRKK